MPGAMRDAPAAESEQLLMIFATLTSGTIAGICRCLSGPIAQTTQPLREKAITMRHPILSNSQDIGCRLVALFAVARLFIGHRFMSPPAGNYVLVYGLEKPRGLRCRLPA